MRTIPALATDHEARARVRDALASQGHVELFDAPEALLAALPRLRVRATVVELRDDAGRAALPAIRQIREQRPSQQRAACFLGCDRAIVEWVDRWGRFPDIRWSWHA
jgi:hypothetical protein